MKYLDFVEKIEEDGIYTVEQEDIFIYVFEIESNELMCSISYIEEGVIDTSDLPNKEFLKNHICTISDFIKTPIENREYIEDYYLIHKYLGSEDQNFIKQNRVTEELIIGNKDNTQTHKSIFTKQEIEELERNSNFTLRDVFIKKI